MVITDAFTIVNRFEGARELLASENVRLYEITDIIALSSILHKANLLNDEIFERIKKQIGLI
jgi:orotate phosphoribosyltransferase